MLLVICLIGGAERPGSIDSVKDLVPGVGAAPIFHGDGRQRATGTDEEQAGR